MTCVRARCTVCQWNAKASGENFLNMAVRAHEASTGHKIKT